MKRDHEQTAVLSAGEKIKREITLRREMSLGVALREQATPLSATRSEKIA